MTVTSLSVAELLALVVVGNILYDFAWGSIRVTVALWTRFAAQRAYERRMGIRK